MAGISIPDGWAGQCREGTEGDIKGGGSGDIGTWEERRDSKQGGSALNSMLFRLADWVGATDVYGET